MPVCDEIRSGAGNPMENTQGSIAIEFRQGWGWLVLAALMISTIGDEITLLTLMFRTAESARAYGVPALLIAELLPGLIAAPWAGRLIDRRGAGRVLVVVSALQAAAIALIAYYPAFTLAGAALLSVLFTITSAATFALIPVLASALGMTLARANSFLEVVRSLGMLAGPVAGGVLVGCMGSTNALLIAAASFTPLLLLFPLSRLHPAPPEPRTNTSAATVALIPVLASALGMTLARANSFLEVVRSLGMLAGPVAGGVLVGWMGSTNALLIDAASVTLLLLVVAMSGLRRAPQEHETEETTLLADYRPLLGNRRVMVVTGALSLEVFATAIADVAFVFLIIKIGRAHV